MRVERREGFFRRWRRGERGFGEFAAAIFVLPVLIALVFTLIELGWYLRYRAMVDEATRLTTMMVAQEGANTTQPWSALKYVDPSAKWSDFGKEQLRMLCFNAIPAQTASGGGATGAVPSGIGQRCSQPPTMTCTPENLQENPGEVVRCNSTFYYTPLTALGRSPIFSFGFSGLFARPIEIFVVSRTSVGNGRP